MSFSPVMMPGGIVPAVPERSAMTAVVSVFSAVPVMGHALLLEL